MKPGTTIENLNTHHNRRKFIVDVTKAVGATVMLSSPLFSSAKGVFAYHQQTYTVGRIMDLFIKEVPGAPFPNTVDTLKAGNRDIIVTGIVTTMFATIDVIEKAISIGANFIIAHEPTFYNHTDSTDWLEHSDVYNYKADLLQRHNIAVWRNHDYIHSLTRDGVQLGVLKQLGWQKYVKEDLHVINLENTLTLSQLINYAKRRLNISTVRYIGNLSLPCKKIVLLPGAAGEKKHIDALIKVKPDVLICGEISEWETAEYVRDSISKGDKVSLVVLGHIASEEPGSEFMLEWLKTHVPTVKVTHIPSGNSLSFA